MNKKAFTLVELLVVIAILAVLTSAVVLVLNPAELIRQSRDSARVSDLQTVQRALRLWLATYENAAYQSFGGFSTATTTCGFSGGCTLRTSRAVNGTGWVAADLTQSTGGSPVGVLPLDPINNVVGGVDYQYAWKGSSTLVFELNARLESNKYVPLMTNDGGEDSTCTSPTSTSCYYEFGTASGLNL